MDHHLLHFLERKVHIKQNIKGYQKIPNICMWILLVDATGFVCDLFGENVRIHEMRK